MGLGRPNLPITLKRQGNPLGVDINIAKPISLKPRVDEAFRRFGDFFKPFFVQSWAQKEKEKLKALLENSPLTKSKGEKNFVSALELTHWAEKIKQASFQSGDERLTQAITKYSTIGNVKCYSNFKLPLKICFTPHLLLLIQSVIHVGEYEKWAKCCSTESNIGFNIQKKKRTQLALNLNGTSTLIYIRAESHE